jgi:orotate phosphoribosyltransferase
MNVTIYPGISVNSKYSLSVASALIDTGSYLCDLHKPKQSWYTWKSGIVAPCYCNCRTLLSHPKERALVVESLCHSLKGEFVSTDAVIGIATAGIPWASFISYQLNLPAAYIRSSEKEHGLGNLLEGDLKNNSKTVLIDDLIASGESIKAAIDIIEKMDCSVLGVISIVNWGFEKMSVLLNGIKIICSTSYPQILETLSIRGLLSSNEVSDMTDFYRSPATHIWRSVND